MFIIIILIIFSSVLYLFFFHSLIIYLYLFIRLVIASFLHYFFTLFYFFPNCSPHSLSIWRRAFIFNLTTIFSFSNIIAVFNSPFNLIAFLTNRFSYWPFPILRETYSLSPLFIWFLIKEISISWTIITQFQFLHIWKIFRFQ